MKDIKCDMCGKPMDEAGINKYYGDSIKCYYIFAGLIKGSSEKDICEECNQELKSKIAELELDMQHLCQDKFMEYVGNRLMDRLALKPAV